MSDTGFLNLDWGNKGSSLFDCLNCAPCCGDPCNPKDGIYCLLTWWCCGLCNFSKLYASSLDQECALINHFIPTWCCGICVHVATRNGLRRKAGVGGNTTMELVGDGLLAWCCGYCSGCQMLRSVPKKDWDFIGAVTSGSFKFTPSVQPFKMIRE